MQKTQDSERSEEALVQQHEVAAEEHAAPPLEEPRPAESAEAPEGSRVSQYVSMARGAVAETVASIQDQGVRAWVAGAAEVVGQTARESLDQARLATGEAGERARAAAVDTAAKAKEVASDRTVQTTAAAATGGAVVVGIAGGGTGFATGATIGAAVGLVPALFTFGLSIPVGGAIGGGVGMITGATAGGVVGAVGGGAAGYGAYTKRAEIAEAANETADFVKDRASDTVGFVCEKAAVVRARLVGGGTGSTEDTQ